jgi:glutamine---fructose-6-phosphate transaminase (isomerizing)
MKYNMLQHIYETPEALRRTLKKAERSLAQFSKACRRRRWDSVILTGCGASYHDAVAARPAFEQLIGIPTSACPASELGVYPHEFFTDRHLLIAISRSGEKSDIMAAVRAAKRSDSFVVAVTATPDSLLAEAADAVLLTHEGPEYCQPKTKSFVSVLGVLILMAIHLMPPGAKKRQKELLKGLGQMPKLIGQTIRSCQKTMRKAAIAMRSCRHAYVTGMQSNLGAILEAALKLKEASFVHAEAFPTGEVAQGPLLLVKRNWAYIPFITETGRDLSLRMIHAAHRKGATVIALCSDADGVEENAEFVVTMPSLPSELFAPMAYIIPVQMLAYYLATDKKLNPDDPAGFDMILELILEPGRSEPEMRKN